MLRFSIAALACLLGASHAPARAQTATCVDTTGDMCLNVIRTARADGVVDDIFATSDGRFAPQLTFGTYVGGVNGCIGQTYDPRILSGYTCCDPAVAGCAPPGGTDPAFHANSLDWYWTQVLRSRDDGSIVADGEGGFYVPWRGRIYDLGGEANRVVLFPITDHAPLPCEAFEYAVWLSNDPAATEVATPDAPDPAKWNPALLIRVFTQGWTRNPTATGAADAARADLTTFLRDTSAGDAVADALVTVWALPCGLSFRYVAIQAGNYGNPGPECVYHSSDDELDAVAGLNEDDTIICVDADGDGHRDATCGGGDCDDTDATVHPGAFEPCDATRDLDCLPMRACPTGTVCDPESGLCVAECFEGGCSTGYECTSGRCVEALCAARTEPCPDGTRCRAGECVAPCDGVVCPRGQLCRGGACIDPCEGVVCPANQVCVAADPDARTVCGPSCNCTELAAPLCPSDEACDTRAGSATEGHCVDPGCETAICADTEACAGGACVDACDGVTCPTDQVCVDGSCVPDRCARVSCPGAQVCRDGECYDACDGVMCGPGLLCRDGACVPDPCDGIECGEGFRCAGGTCVPLAPDGGSASADGGTPDGGRRAFPEHGGCCAVAPGAPIANERLVGLLVLGLMGLCAARGRRRR